MHTDFRPARIESKLSNELTVFPMSRLRSPIKGDVDFRNEILLAKNFDFQLIIFRPQDRSRILHAGGLTVGVKNGYLEING